MNIVSAPYPSLALRSTKESISRAQISHTTPVFCTCLPPSNPFSPSRLLACRSYDLSARRLQTPVRYRGSRASPLPCRQAEVRVFTLWRRARREARRVPAWTTTRCIPMCLITRREEKSWSHMKSSRASLGSVPAVDGCRLAVGCGSWPCRLCIGWRF